MNGKVIQRSEFTQNIQNNARRVAENLELYKQRQALVEHPYGTMKRQWGFDHIMTKKGIKRAEADFGLIALAYNLKRMVNLGLTTKEIVKYVLNRLKKLLFLPKTAFEVLKFQFYKSFIVKLKML